MTAPKQPRVYLAGPGVFRPDAIAFGKALKDKCADMGLEGCFPMDNEIHGTSKREMAAQIYAANVRLIEKADAIVADISPLRGPNMDPGTAWEIGYGIAIGLPVFAWTDHFSFLAERTPGKSGERPVDEKGWDIENFDHIENLMIACSAISIGKTAEAALAACAEYFKGKKT